MDWMQILTAIIPIIAYALIEAFKAYKEGEELDIVKLIKTVVIALVMAGLLEQGVADLILLVVSSTVFSYILDKIINALFSRFRVKRMRKRP